MIGGAGNDVLTATTLTTLTGGDGADTFKFGTAGATTYSKITDLSWDIIDVGLSSEGMTWNSTAVSLSSNATFVNYLDSAAAGTADIDTSTSAADEVLVRWFQFGGNTYLVTDREEHATNGDATGFGAADTVIEIEGLVDLSTATLNATAGQFIIA